jgi:uncharacterized protein YjiS (DUF1127 family)
VNTSNALRATGSLTAKGLLARLATAFSARRGVRATQDAVEHLDAHLLRDIGLDAVPSERAIRRRLLIG